jgi:1,4-alpha-glucan branching enzyme
VKLAGDFSQWVSHAVTMQPAGGGWWTAKLTLPPGDYRFRYIADGFWYTDFASHGIEVCDNGWNSVVLVPQRPMLKVTTSNRTTAKSAA